MMILVVVACHLKTFVLCRIKHDAVVCFLLFSPRFSINHTGSLSHIEQCCCCCCYKYIHILLCFFRSENEEQKKMLNSFRLCSVCECVACVVVVLSALPLSSTTIQYVKRESINKNKVWPMALSVTVSTQMNGMKAQSNIDSGNLRYRQENKNNFESQQKQQRK